MSELLLARIAENAEIISTLSQERADRVKLVATGDTTMSMPDRRGGISYVDAQIATLEREVAILRAELIALRASAAEPNEPPVIAGQPDEGIQEALVYLGHYDGRIDGDLGRRSREAISACQRSLGKKLTGHLTSLERGRLLDEAMIRRKAHGMRLAGEQDAGYAFLYPSRLMPFERYEGEGYRRFSTPSDTASLQVVGSSIERLETLYSTLLARPGFSVAYSRLGNDWFVVAGEIGDMLYYDIARRERRDLARLRLAYPLVERALWDPMTMILFNSFRLDDPKQAASGPQSRSDQVTRRSPSLDASRETLYASLSKALRKAKFVLWRPGMDQQE